MVIALVILILLFAFAGGLFVHPLLFLLALLAIAIFLSGGRTI